MNSRELFYLFIRYLIIVLVGLFGINLIYTVFTPLTIYPSLWILKLFYNLNMENNTLILGRYSINIISACIAGAAYYLLLILNLSTPMKTKTRVNSLVFSVIFFLAFNIIRLVIFASLFFAGYSYFDLAHKAVWYLGSTIFVVALWFLNVSLFKIKSVPAYTDLKNLFGNIRYKRKRKK